MVETVTKHGVDGTASESSSLIESLFERIGGQARASTIYGDPVEREGVTVIPVARDLGRRRRCRTRRRGPGGLRWGGGLLLSPVWYIEIQAGSSSFRPIFKPPLGALSLIVGVLLGLAIAHVARACRGDSPR